MKVKPQYVVTIHLEDCEGWWLSGNRSSVAEHLLAV